MRARATVRFRLFAGLRFASAATRILCVWIAGVLLLPVPTIAPTVVALIWLGWAALRSWGRVVVVSADGVEIRTWRGTWVQLPPTAIDDVVLTYRIAPRRWAPWTPREPVLVATIVSEAEQGSVPCWPLAAFRHDEQPRLEATVTSLRAQLVSAKGGSLPGAPMAFYVVSAPICASPVR